jgi:hypothetical protein
MWLSTIAASRLCAAGDGVKIAGEMQVDLGHRHDLRIAAARRAALHAETGAERGLAQAIIARAPSAGVSASPRPTVVVVLPSPAGVGLMAVTSTSLPSGQHFKDDATAFNAKKHEVIDGKGVLNNRISNSFSRISTPSACRRISSVASTCASS